MEPRSKVTLGIGPFHRSWHRSRWKSGECAKRFIFFSILIAIAPALHGQATVEGTVQLPAASASYGFNQRYATSADVPTIAKNPPAAIVYLEGNFELPQEPLAAAVMAQKNTAFAPDLVAVMVGGSAVFPNEDDMYHSVFSYSKAKRFDLGRYRKDEKTGPCDFR
jgi:plastocyanin